MKSVIGVGKLVEILEKNKEAHRETFLEALEGYKVEAIKVLTEKLEAVKNNKRLPQVWINLPMPEDHTDDYERAIKLLRLDTRAEVELTEGEFAQYVMDDWGWKGQWASNTVAYASVVNPEKYS
jgi:predicted KAP-like P-loop ATPase